MSQAFMLAATVVLVGLAGVGCEQAPFGEAGQAGKGKSPSSFKLEPAQLSRGQAVYKKHCLKCHGESGKGTVLDWRIRDAKGHFPPPPLNDTARASHLTTSELLEIIREGSPAGEGKMPAWKGKLSEREIENVVAYIKSLWTPAVYRLWWNIEQHSLEG